MEAKPNEEASITVDVAEMATCMGEVPEVALIVAETQEGTYAKHTRKQGWAPT